MNNEEIMEAKELAKEFWKSPYGKQAFKKRKFIEGNITNEAKDEMDSKVPGL